MTPAIHIFNPDTDYALAKGTEYYTPPKSVLKLADEMAYMPREFAHEHDLVLPYAEIPNILEFAGGHEKLMLYHIAPWGWNLDLRRRLSDAGVPESKLPSPDDIKMLRLLSHRRTTIEANSCINESLSVIGADCRHFSPIPLEFSNEDRFKEFLSDNPAAAFLKAPWSSSGRGILYTPDYNDKQILEWAHGIIRRQGSLMYEPAADKAIDFATEWIIHRGHPQFLGLSLFEASRRGKYHHNISTSQSQLLYYIRQKAPDFGEEFISAQKEMLKSLIAPYYQGPLGIDMIADKEGNIRSCIEINLRMTMGHVALLKNQKMNESEQQ